MSIGGSAFNRCRNLTSINIPSSVTNIGSSAFNGCTRLASINVDENNNRYADIDGILFNKEKNRIIRYPESKKEQLYNIPNSVTSIGDYAFYYCSNLTSINIPSSVTNIGSSAFSNCTKLTSINIPNSVTSIGGSAFSYCINLTSINIPSSVTNIGTYAFNQWTSAQTINCQVNSVPAGWIGTYSRWNSGCNATIKWGVSM